MKAWFAFCQLFINIKCLISLVSFVWLFGSKIVSDKTLITHEHKHLAIARILESVVSKVDTETEPVIFDSNEYNTWVDEAHQCILDKNPNAKLCLQLEHNGEIVVVGDIHGSLPDAVTIANKVVGSPESTKFVFLGDYTDRGADGPAVLALVMSLQCLYPDKVILLRGNHESARVNRRYGFADQIDKVSPSLLEKIDKLIYQSLPQCAKINDIFFVHGGPSITEFENPEDVFNVGIGHEFAKHSGLLWNDPRSGVIGTIPSTRGAGIHYGSEVLDDWCKSVGVKEVYRGHEVVKGGIRRDYNGNNYCKHHTVFSSWTKKGPGAYVVIHPQKSFNGEYQYDIIPLIK